MPDGQASTGNAEIVITDNAAARIAKLIEMEDNESLKLRIAISGGGCSGFVYGFELDEAISDDDLVFEHNGIKVLVDETSIELIKGSELHFKEEMLGAFFTLENPNASATCGCGTSFAV
jgi:iron-sulfur cluster insertion protein